MGRSISRVLRSRVGTAMAAAVVAATAAGVITAYATTSSTTVYWACLKSGSLSNVTVNQQPATCTKGSTIVSWNAQGIQGNQGPQGIGVSAAPVANGGCGAPGGYTLTQSDPSTGGSTVVGDVCNGAAGAPGAGLSSLDSLTGLACDNGTGITHVAYSGTAVSLTCDPPPSTLTVTTSGTGSGTITSSPAGISCGAGGTTCSMQVAPGTSVTLTVSPSSGSAWTGTTACTPNRGPSCTVTLTADTTVDFAFTAGRVLTVSSNDGGFTSNDASISCPGPYPGGTGIGTLGCQAAYPDGTAVTLTFHRSIDPPAGQPDWMWNGGGCSGPASTPCTVVMTADQYVTAGY